NLAFPTKTLKNCNTMKQQNVKWFHSDLKIMRENFDRLCELHNTLKCTESKLARDKFRSLYRSKITEAKINYNQKTIDASNNRSAAMWKIINQQRDRLTCSDNATNCDITCDEFNEFFSTVASKLLNSTQNQPNL